MAFSKLLHLYFLSARSLTLGVRAVISMADGRIVLVRHTYIKGWHLPGGGVERGETAMQALHREIAQETGLELSDDCTLHGMFHNGTVSPRDHVMVYACNAVGPIPPLKTNLEIAEVGVFSPDALPEDTDSGARRRIAEVRDGAPVSAAW